MCLLTVAKKWRHSEHKVCIEKSCAGRGTGIVIIECSCKKEKLVGHYHWPCKVAGAIRFTKSCMSTSHPLWGMNRNEILSNVQNKLGLLLPKGNQPINDLLVLMKLGIPHFWG